MIKNNSIYSFKIILLHLKVGAGQDNCVRRDSIETEFACNELLFELKPLQALTFDDDAVRLT